MAVERLSEESFTRVSTALIRNPELSNTGFRTYALLLSYRWQSDSCFPSQERLASDSGMTRKTIRAGLAELVELGLIRQQRRGQRYCNMYSFSDGSNIPIKHGPDEQKVPISIAQWGKKDPSDGVKITHEEEAIEKDSVAATPEVSQTMLQDVCQRLGIKKDIDAEELVERSMATLPDTDHIARALKCKGHYSDWSKKTEMKRAGHFASFCETEKNPRERPGYTIQAASSNGGSTPSEYVKSDTPIKSTIPQFIAFFSAVKATGTCRIKVWDELESLQERVKTDGTLLFIARDEQEKRRIERNHGHRIDMACRDVNMSFAIACGA